MPMRSNPNVKYKKDHPWRGQIEVWTLSEPVKMTGKLTRVINAKSRQEAWDKLRKLAVKLTKMSKTRQYTAYGVSMKPTDFKGR